MDVIAKTFDISITELISGNIINNGNVSANMMCSKFYVCPVCGNIIHCMGEAVIQCHGLQLVPYQAEEVDEDHSILIERVDDEYYVRIEHEMTKQHYISFIAALSSDKLQMIKLYPEGNAEGRFKMKGVKKILFYCRKDGLFGTAMIQSVHNRKIS